ncbi:37S ribosomal protein S35 [Paramyrothecium foliicola]|nr:37S ribosomal protein S35 [Paramyrothecium foliicola]
MDSLTNITMPPRVRAPSVSVPASLAEAPSQRLPRATSFARTFSSTSCQAGRPSRGRQFMMKWLQTQDATRLENATSPRYIGPFEDQPFPHNPLFRSQPVLSEQTKTLIWEKVTQRGDSLKGVSAEMGVDVRRVAAVVRLKEVERQWITENKKLATPYAKAIMGMLPKTHFTEGEKNKPHEPINEVLVHRMTTQQLFVPVAESRVFTRKDAAKAFHQRLRTVDERSPQPQLIKMERAVLNGKGRTESMDKFMDATEEEEERLSRSVQRAREHKEKMTTRHQTDRFEFRIKDFNSDVVGRDGKSVRGTGWRYGVPYNDRKKGAVKIPTRVPEAQ